MRLPIRIRLSLIYSTILVVAVGSLELAGYVSVRTAIYSLTDQELNTRLAGIEDHLARHLNVVPWADLKVAMLNRPAFHPSLLVMRSGTGELMLQGDGMAGIRAAGESAPIFNDAKSGIRVLSARRTIAGRPYQLMLGTDLGLSSSILQRLWLGILLSIPPLLVLCGWTGYWVSGRALAPIQEIVAVARSIDWRRLNQRVPVGATRDEVQQLAETVNGMLERIEDGAHRMRDFTANASHELRTPVAIVRAAAEVALLRQDADAAWYREALERILRESERNTVLIERILELARADSRVDGQRRDSVDLNHSMVEACQKMSSLAAAKGIALRCQRTQGPAEVMAHPDQLGRLWLILLDNAIKYTPEGGTVTARIADGGSGQLVAEIVDTGIGIAAEHHALIFERFYRTDKARSRRMGGAGLGLAIAREIALAHNAEMRVESSPGAGSRFWLTFPAPNREAGEARRQEAQAFR